MAVTHKPKKPDPAPAKPKTKEDEMIDAAGETMHEMRDAMTTMMGASSKMMQAFIDMRLSYLKVMRAGLEDPQTASQILTKNFNDVAKALGEKPRE